MGISAAIDAIVEAAASAASAVGSSFSAVAAGAATVGDVAVVAGVSGSVLSAVGAVTHNNTVTDIGLGLGAAGAVTGLASAGGLFSAAEAAEGPTGLEGAAAKLKAVPGEGDVTPGESVAAAGKGTGSGVVPTASPTGPGVAQGAAVPTITPTAEQPLAPFVGSPNYSAMTAEDIAQARSPLTGGNYTTVPPGTPGAVAPGEAPATPYTEGPESLWQPSSTVPPGETGTVVPGEPFNAGAMNPADMVQAPGETGDAGLMNSATSGTTSSGASTTLRPGEFDPMQGRLAELSPAGQNTLQKVADKTANGDLNKMLMMLVGGQAVTGLGGGMLQSLSMSDQMALQKLIAQRQQNQLQYQNQNNQFAPNVSFATPTPTGLLGTAAPLRMPVTGGV